MKSVWVVLLFMKYFIQILPLLCNEILYETVILDKIEFDRQFENEHFTHISTFRASTVWVKRTGEGHPSPPWGGPNLTGFFNKNSVSALVLG